MKIFVLFNILFILNESQSYILTTKKPLSIGAKVHIFLLKLIGKYDIFETTIDRTTEYDDLKYINSRWSTESFTFPLETTTTTIRTTTTPEPPYKLMMQIPAQFENGTFGIVLQEAPIALLDVHKKINGIINRYGRISTTIPPYFVKVYITTTTENSEIIDNLATDKSDE
ncbi:hypothetical protein PVAND_016682 [Polypedilum vanderplanki]|uniref:Uncharacterized protein n=1 Tax=Polypedilum vanderplanki TaxID=319348 RepID=A0A9J6BGW2_POLVA|nr:hypothetical protein PVAND_016682 [Polypedilum vanderplanki]